MTTAGQIKWNFKMALRECGGRWSKMADEISPITPSFSLHALFRFVMRAVSPVETDIISSTSSLKLKLQ